jgi:hypothetical protein
MPNVSQPGLEVGEPSVNGEWSTPEGLGGSAAPKEPTDPFEASDFCFTETEYDYSSVVSDLGQKPVKVRKPRPQEFFRVHPVRWPVVGVYLRETEEQIQPVPYLIKRAFWELFEDRLYPFRLYLVVNSFDTEFLWGVKLPRDGVRKDYHISVDDAIAAAETSWVRLLWDNPSRVYTTRIAQGDLGDPRFTEGRSFDEWVRLAFQGHIVERSDDPLVLEHQGHRRIK